LLAAGSLNFTMSCQAVEDDEHRRLVPALGRMPLCLRAGPSSSMRSSAVSVVPFLRVISLPEGADPGATSLTAELLVVQAGKKRFLAQDRILCGEVR